MQCEKDTLFCLESIQTLQINTNREVTSFKDGFLFGLQMKELDQKGKQMDLSFAVSVYSKKLNKNMHMYYSRITKIL